MRARHIPCIGVLDLRLTYRFVCQAANTTESGSVLTELVNPFGALNQIVEYLITYRNPKTMVAEHVHTDGKIVGVAGNCKQNVRNRLCEVDVSEVTLTSLVAVSKLAADVFVR